MIINVCVTPRAKFNRLEHTGSPHSEGYPQGGVVLGDKISNKDHPADSKHPSECGEPVCSLKIHTTAAPTDGAANAAVVKLLAKHFDVAKSRIRIIRGETSRDKVFEVNN